MQNQLCVFVFLCRFLLRLPLRRSRSTTIFFFFFFNDPATTEIYTLSLHDALPISRRGRPHRRARHAGHRDHADLRSEEHTSELQSPVHLVCRLLLEKKKKTDQTTRR